MALRLSTGELEQLRATLETLLSPLDYETGEQWMHASLGRLRELLRADNAHGFIPEVGWISDVDESARRAYLEYYHQFDVAPLLARERGLPVSTYESLVGREAFHASEFYSDWVKPNGLERSHGMSFPLESRAPTPTFPYMAVSHRRRVKDAVVERGESLLWLLLPAFQAGVCAFTALGARRERLMTLLDRMAVPVAVCERSGRALHRNSRLSRLLSGDPQGRLVERALRSVARAVSGVARRRRPPTGVPHGYGERRVTTSRGTYRVCAIQGGVDLLRPGCALVTVEPLFRVPLSDDRLRERYALTRREIEVARQLAADRSNIEIARALRISPHTARHHTESVMMKLGVRSRTRVKDRITS